MRYFIDTLEVTGDFYLIPIQHRSDWEAFDTECEETCERLPVPAWAMHVPDGLAGLRWIIFEMPDGATP